MPAGRTHDKITFVGSVVVGAVGCASYGLTIGMIVTTAFLFSGLMFNGDLDHDAEATCYSRWWALKYLFWPYMKIMPHRSIWSHGPVIGTAVRLLYVGIYVAIVLAYPIYRDMIAVDDLVLWVTTYKTELIAAAAGLELGSLSHTLADWMPHWIMRRLFKE